MDKDRFGIEITKNARQSASGSLPANVMISDLTPADVLARYPEAVGYDHVGRMYVITARDALLYHDGHSWGNPGRR